MIILILNDFVHDVFCVGTSDGRLRTDPDCGAGHHIQVAALFIEGCTKNIPQEIWTLCMGRAALQ